MRVGLALWRMVELCLQVLLGESLSDLVFHPCSLLLCGENGLTLQEGSFQLSTKRNTVTAVR